MDPSLTDYGDALILVVDDDDANRLMAREVLEGAGFAVAEAEDGEAALTAFNELRPQAVLLDVIMPKMDGYTACGQLRALRGGEHTPILIMTGLNDVESINRAYSVGATDFVTKPLNHILLPHRLRYMLRSKWTSDDLRASQARLNAAQRLARLGHWELDPHADSIDWSEGFESIFGLPLERGAGNYRDFLKFVHPKDRQQVEETLAEALRSDQGFTIEHRIVRPDGGEHFVLQEAEVATDEAGEKRIVGTLQDISERRLAEEQIRRLAYFDNVTGLPNRTLVHEHMTRALAEAKREGTSIAVLFLDLDRFKRINDTLGHSAGDELLRQVAGRLTHEIRRSDMLGAEHSCRWATREMAEDGDTVARLGGDEFVIVLANLARAENAAIVARRVCEELRKPFSIGNNEVYVNASIGISAFPDDGDSVESLLKNADAAMYHAKAQGRDRYQFYTASINARALERLVLETNLRKALDQDQFVLHYQPKVCIGTGDVVGMEAVVRWEHPDLGIVSPAEFVSVAEETGLIVPLGEWVLGKACAQAKAWQEAGLGFKKIAVNLSAAQCNNQELQESVLRALKHTGLPAEGLELELTERLLMEHLDSAMTLLTELKAIGVQLAIDDFGTGYSSLGNLKQLPIDSIKIDHSFIRGIREDATDAAMVSGIITLAHKLGIRVVAEGVEEIEQLEFLQQHGCDEAQGYFFSSPKAPEQATEWLREECPDHRASTITPRRKADA